jgi:hypothetical protein
MGGKLGVSQACVSRLTIDIIFLLIVGFACTASFFFWEHYIQTKTTRPPLMRLQLWTRAKGRLATVYAIGFISWMGFVVCPLYFRTVTLARQ